MMGAGTERERKQEWRPANERNLEAGTRAGTGRERDRG